MKIIHVIALILVGWSFGTGNTQAKYLDDETDLVYYGYRYYNPTGGRWLSRDPIGEKVGKNLYAFAANDSVNNIDFYGLTGTVTVSVTPYMSTSLVWAESGFNADLTWSPPSTWAYPNCACAPCQRAAWTQYLMNGTIDIGDPDPGTSSPWICGKTANAFLLDKPHIGSVSIFLLKWYSPVSWAFEDTLTCTAGSDAGKIYATVFWGGTYTYDAMPVPVLTTVH
jgi:RHS repeat-associated protein